MDLAVEQQGHYDPNTTYGISQGFYRSLQNAQGWIDFLCDCFWQIESVVLIDLCVCFACSCRSNINRFPIGRVSIAHTHHIVYVCDRHQNYWTSHHAISGADQPNHMD